MATSVTGMTMFNRARAFCPAAHRLPRVGWGAGIRSVLAMLLLSSGATAWAALGASVTIPSGQPGTVYPGDLTQLQITLSNSNTAASVSSVAFSNALPGTLPNGLKVAGAVTYTCTDPATATTAPGVGSLTAALGTQAIILTNGVIPARANNTDGTCVITIPVSAGSSNGASATYTYTIASGAVTGNDGAAVANVGAVNQSLNVRSMAVPTVNKSFSSSVAYLGGAPVTLTITVANSNPVAIPNFSVTDNFPQLGGNAIIQVAGTPAATSACTGAGVAPTFVPAAGATTISATGGTLAANGSCTITVKVEAAHTNGVYDTGLLSNTIVGATDFSNDIGLVPANASASIRARSPLRVAKAFAHPFVANGQPDSMAITLFNDGTSALPIVSMTDDPIDGTAAGAAHPAYGLTVTGVSTTCGGAVAQTANNTGLTLTGGSIPAGGSCTVTANYTGTVQVAGTPTSYTNTLSAGAVNTGNPAIISQSASAAVMIADDLRVTKTATPSSAAPGNPVRFAVTVENYGATAIASVVITDTLTNGLTFLTGTINGNTYTPVLSGTGCSGLSVTGAVGATAPVFTIGTLPARSSPSAPGSCTVTFYAMTPTNAVNGASISNTIGANSVCYNAGATCNGAPSNTTGGSVTTSTLAVAKAFGLSSPRAEGTIVRMTITLTNLSASPLTGASIADTLPLAAGGGQMRVASPANAATTCGAATITAVSGSTSVTLNGGTLPARAANGTGAAGSCTLQVDVVGPAGVYANTATAAATETYADGSTHSVGPVSANANFTYSSALSSAKSFNPVAISSGGKSTVTVRLTNTSALALSGVSVVDPLPAGMVVASPPNAYTTCAGPSSVSATAGSSSASLAGASIAGGSNCDFLFDVVATGAANWVNSIPIGNITADGGISNQTAVAATLTRNVPNNPAITKATNPSTLSFPGQVSQLTITISNGSQAVTNLGLTDYFTADGTAGAAPNGMVIAPAPAASTTCPGGVVAALPGGTSVSLSGASLVASASCTVSVNVASTIVGGITNFIPAGSLFNNEGLTNAGQATTSLTTQSNIGIVKQFIPGVVKAGERARLRLTLFNPTAQPATSLSVTDTLPAGLTVPSGPNPTSNCTGALLSSPAANQFQVAGVSMPAAVGTTPASCYAEIDVVAAAAGDYVNTIPGGAVTATVGGLPATNAQPASATLYVKQPVVIHKAIAGMTLDAGNPVGLTTGSAAVTPGTAATLTIRLDNPNSTALTAAALADALPSGLVVATTPNASTTCVGGVVTAPVSATSVRLTGATLPAGGFCTVSVSVLSNVPNTYTNTIPASALTTFEGVTNEEASSARLIVSTPPTVSKQFSPPVISPGGGSTLTIVLGNSNAGAATLTSALVDNLPSAPGAMTVAAPNLLSTTCPGAVSAPAGGSTVTYPSGASIPAGGCTISVSVTASVPGDYVNNIPAGGLATTLGNNQQPTNSTLSVSTLGYISGRVFRDNNVIPDGIFTTGTDSPIAGASIELRSGVNCSGALVAAAGLTNPASTDALGNYLFAGLPAGTYSVCQPLQPNGTLNGKTTNGSIVSVAGSTGAAGGASNPSVSSSQIVGIVLNGDGAGGAISGSIDNNFAEIVPSSIAGTVFSDLNNNGVQNGTDPGIAGVTVDLTGYSYGPDGVDNNGTGDDVGVTRTTTTDAAGNYAFANLAPGKYSVTEPTQPANTSNGQTLPGVVPNGGTPGTGTAVGVTPSKISNIVLPPNTASTGNNFAEIPNGRRLLGKVFLDFNNNGVMNGPDRGIGGQTLNLTGTDINGNPVTRSTVTAADGTYAFTGLPEGANYTVTQPAQPTGTRNGLTLVGSTGGAATAVGTLPSALSGINLAGANTVSADNDFAEVPNGITLTGKVFVDYDDSGTMNGADRGIAGQTIQLTGTDYAGNLVSQSAQTQPDGSYTFSGLPEGTYTLTQPAQPPGTLSGQTAPGSAGGVASLPNAVPSTISGIALKVTTPVAAGYDFAEIPNSGSVSGRVFLDLDKNGQFNGNDRGIGGQTINLTGTDVNGNAVSKSTVTAADGTYTFTDVPEGTYTLTQPAQPAGTLNGITTPGSSGGTASAVTVTPSTITGVRLSGANPVSTNNNFAETQATPTPDLVLAKTHSPASFAAGGNVGYYRLVPSNAGTLATTGTITVSDTLPGGMTLAAVPTGAGWRCTGSVGAPSFTCSSDVIILPASEGAAIIARVAVAAGLQGQTLTNTAQVAGGGEPTDNQGNNIASDATPIAQSASLQGHVWLDRSHNRRFADPLAVPLPGWTVELLLNDVLVATTQTDQTGLYTFSNLAPGSGYRVRFRHPVTGQLFGSAVPNEDPLIRTYVSGAIGPNNPAGATTTDGTLANLTLPPGSTTVEQSLPVDPTGIVYDAVSRQPVAGATVTLSGPAGFNPATHVLGGSASQVTGPDGMYQFLLTPSAPSGSYTLAVAGYPGGYVPQVSTLIPACANSLSVGITPNPALVQSNNAPPLAGVPVQAPGACPASSGALAPVNQGTTQYYFVFVMTIGGGLQSGNVVNNHIPLDPVLGGAIVMSKTTPMVNVMRSDLVPYTVTATNTLAATLPKIDVIDRIPPGFRYRTGSATLNGLPVEPTVRGRDLVWPNQSFTAREKKTWKLLLVVGAGVGDGEYTNQTWSLNNVVNAVVSNVASATVRVVPDPNFDCSDIIGKVFDDKNANGYQDEGEPGIANVRIATARGLLVTTDAEGRFHVSCAAIPQSDRGANFVMKLDERTLPTGYRLTTENPRDVRVTRGKMAKLNFGATVHRVVRLDLNAQAFAGEGTALAPEWAAKLAALPSLLETRPSVLRIAYRMTAAESAGPAKARLEAVADQIKTLWRQDRPRAEGGGKETPPRHPLIVETELEAAQ